MHPYETLLTGFTSTSYQDLYSTLEYIARNKMGLDGVPFPLSELEHPPGNRECPEVKAFIVQCYKAASGDNTDARAIKLIKFLKDNHPEESYENPKLSKAEVTKDEDKWMIHIFYFGIDLPGSKHNPIGHLQYFSSFFMDIFFGNYTEFFDFSKSQPKEVLERTLKKREGYCQYSPIFAPILGLLLVNLEGSVFFTSKQKQQIRSMYSGCNENQHFEILRKLIKLGADVNAHDIYGYTPLHYAVQYYNEEMVTLLLKHGANINSESRNGWRPLTVMMLTRRESGMRLIDILLQHDAKLTIKEDINYLRTSVETCGGKVLAVRVREAHPREKGECEKCTKPAVKKCSACGLVFYCTPACQKLDWIFHKVSCQKNKRDK